MEFQQYKGELDNCDPVQMGIALCQEGKAWDDDTDPTYRFLFTDADADFLLDFRDSMEKAYYKERSRLRRQAQLDAIPAFQQNIPPVGSRVLVEFPNNPDKKFPCVIEYIPPERTQVLIRMLDANVSDPTINALQLIGYGYPGRFPVFSPLPEESDTRQ